MGLPTTGASFARLSNALQASFATKQTPEIPVENNDNKTETPKSSSWRPSFSMPSFSMPSFSFTNGVVRAAVYGATTAMVASAIAPTYAVTVLTGAVAGAVTKLISNLLADRVNEYVKLVLSNLVGVSVALVAGGAVALSTASLMTLDTLGWVQCAGANTEISKIMQIIANKNFA